MCQPTVNDRWTHADVVVVVVAVVVVVVVVVVVIVVVVVVVVVFVVVVGVVVGVVVVAVVAFVVIDVDVDDAVVLAAVVSTFHRVLSTHETVVGPCRGGVAQLFSHHPLFIRHAIHVVDRGCKTPAIPHASCVFGRCWPTAPGCLESQLTGTPRVGLRSATA